MLTFVELKRAVESSLSHEENICSQGFVFTCSWAADVYSWFYSS
jgi:hypothetical protein